MVATLSDVKVTVARPVWRMAILRGDILRGKTCQVQITGDGKIIRCDILQSIWSGDVKFDAWFREEYRPELLEFNATSEPRPAIRR